MTIKPNNDDTTQQFVSLTQCDSRTARHFLKRNQWNINYALNEFYDHKPGGFIEESIVNVTYPEELVELYNHYANKDLGKIDIEGMIKLISDLNYKLEDLVTISLAKIMHCTSLSDGISKDNFLSTWYMHGCCTIPQMRHVLEDLDAKLETDLEYMTEIYRYAFDLALDSRSRNLDLDTATEYWRLFLQPRYPVHVDEKLMNAWLVFLKDGDHTTVTRDTWQMLLEFLKRFPSLEAVKEKYNEADAWPYIIDEFYEYLEDGKLI